MLEKIYMILRKNDVEIEYDTFVYGFISLIKYMIFFILLFAIAIIINLVYEVFLLSILFCVLRKYSGGFHFTSNVICFSFSVLSILLFSYLIHICHFSIFLTIVIGFCSFFIVKYLSPQDCKNKRLTQSEKKYYNQISKLLVFLFSIFSIIFYTNFNIISRAIIISLIFLSLNLIIANYINNHK